MSTYATLRATTRWGEFAWAAALSVMGALVGLTSAAMGDAGASSGLAIEGSARTAVLDPLRFVPLSGLPLMFRYQFSSAPSVLFWFDSIRQGVPGITASSLRAEALRLVLLLAAMLTPLAAASVAIGGVDALGVMLPSLGVALASVGIGAMSAVMPYRWAPGMMLATLGVVIVVIAGWLPRDAASSLGLGFAVFAICLAFAARRLRDLRRRGVDPAVGGDYAYAFSFGRHGGAHEAPNSAPSRC